MYNRIRRAETFSPAMPPEQFEELQSFWRMATVQLEAVGNEE